MEAAPTKGEEFFKESDLMTEKIKTREGLSGNGSVIEPLALNTQTPLEGATPESEDGNVTIVLNRKQLKEALPDLLKRTRKVLEGKDINNNSLVNEAVRSSMKGYSEEAILDTIGEVSEFAAKYRQNGSHQEIEKTDEPSLPQSVENNAHSNLADTGDISGSNLAQGETNQEEILQELSQQEREINNILTFEESERGGVDPQNIDAVNSAASTNNNNVKEPSVDKEETNKSEASDGKNVDTDVLRLAEKMMQNELGEVKEPRSEEWQRFVQKAGELRVRSSSIEQSAVENKLQERISELKRMVDQPPSDKNRESIELAREILADLENPDSERRRNFLLKVASTGVVTQQSGTNIRAEDRLENEKSKAEEIPFEALRSEAEEREMNEEEPDLNVLLQNSSPSLIDNRLSAENTVDIQINDDQNPNLVNSSESGESEVNVNIPLVEAMAATLATLADNPQMLKRLRNSMGLEPSISKRLRNKIESTFNWIRDFRRKDKERLDNIKDGVSAFREADRERLERFRAWDKRVSDEAINSLKSPKEWGAVITRFAAEVDPKVGYVLMAVNLGAIGLKETKTLYDIYKTKGSDESLWGKYYEQTTVGKLRNKDGQSKLTAEQRRRATLVGVTASLSSMLIADLAAEGAAVPGAKTFVREGVKRLGIQILLPRAVGAMADKIFTGDIADEEAKKEWINDVFKTNSLTTTVAATLMAGVIIQQQGVGFGDIVAKASDLNAKGEEVASNLFVETFKPETPTSVVVEPVKQVGDVVLNNLTEKGFDLDGDKKVDATFHYDVAKEEGPSDHNANRVTSMTTSDGLRLDVNPDAKGEAGVRSLLIQNHLDWNPDQVQEATQIALKEGWTTEDVDKILNIANPVLPVENLESDLTSPIVEDINGEKVELGEAVESKTIVKEDGSKWFIDEKGNVVGAQMSNGDRLQFNPEAAKGGEAWLQAYRANEFRNDLSELPSVDDFARFRYSEISEYQEKGLEPPNFGFELAFEKPEENVSIANPPSGEASNIETTPPVYEQPNFTPFPTELEETKLPEGYDRLAAFNTGGDPNLTDSYWLGDKDEAGTVTGAELPSGEMWLFDDPNDRAKIIGDEIANRYDNLSPVAVKYVAENLADATSGETLKGLEESINNSELNVKIQELFAKYEVQDTLKSLRLTDEQIAVFFRNAVINIEDKIPQEVGSVDDLVKNSSVTILGETITLEELKTPLGRDLLLEKINLKINK